MIEEPTAVELVERCRAAQRPNTSPGERRALLELLVSRRASLRANGPATLPATTKGVKPAQSAGAKPEEKQMAKKSQIRAKVREGRQLLEAAAQASDEREGERLIKQAMGKLAEAEGAAPKKVKNAPGSKALPQIGSREDLESAVADAGDDPSEELRDHLVANARTLGATDCIPDSWLEAVQESLREAFRPLTDGEKAERGRRLGLAGVLGIPADELTNQGGDR